MNEYNSKLLDELKKLKEATSSLNGISDIFRFLENIAEKHIEINSSFEQNLEHLQEYNEEFKNLNNSIRENILNLKETALKFPEQLSDVADKNEKNLKIQTDLIINQFNRLSNLQNDILDSKFAMVSQEHSKIKTVIIVTLLVNFATLICYLLNLSIVH